MKELDLDPLKLLSPQPLYVTELGSSGLTGKGRLKFVGVDDTDLSIKFSEGWSVSSPQTSLNVGGTHHFADSTHLDVTAQFNFTGTEVFLLSPLWPYEVGIRVSIDGSQPIPIDMKDPSKTEQAGGPESVSSKVLWSSGELANGTHVLDFSFLPGKQFAAIDALIFTVQDEPTSTTKGILGSGGNNTMAMSTDNSPDSSSDENNPPPSTVPNSNNTSLPERTIVAIVSGTLCGTAVLALMIFFVAVLLRRRRRARKAPSDDFRAGPAYRPGTAPPPLSDTGSTAAYKQSHNNFQSQPSPARSWLTSASSLTRVGSDSSELIAKKKGNNVPLYGIAEEPTILEPFPISVTTMASDEDAAEKGGGVSVGRSKSSHSNTFPNPWRKSEFSGIDDGLAQDSAQIHSPTPLPTQNAVDPNQNPFETHIVPPQTLTEVMDARTYFTHVRSNSDAREERLGGTTTSTQTQLGGGLEKEVVEEKNSKIKEALSSGPGPGPSLVVVGMAVPQIRHVHPLPLPPRRAQVARALPIPK
ncbi:hypothetical protein K435DRAFT_794397 [Dendrothele bispora CBS 962.96]|uniref:Uncharacterized protein n=1 Tax=Dendrothele bispora (strain CBS 962.96) TaxID=1314807 RepID=A0A4S8MCD7_DENBC|nr:hypothetical protein K435DRAFT_794397 [Dendrothele bispora CBS 962.96]